MSTIGPFRVQSSQVKYENPWLTVREDAVIRPGGSEGTFGVVTMVERSSVIALDADSHGQS